MSRERKGSGRATTLAPAPEGYVAWIAEVKQRVRTAQLRASLAVNHELIALYWSIGRDILDKQEKLGWGAGVVDRASADLRAEFPRMQGFSRANMMYMRAFAKAWPCFDEIVQQPVGQLPWSTNLVLLTKLKSREKRLAYAAASLKHGWSRAMLTLHIEQQSVERSGKALTNFERTLPKPLSDLARESLKDPYRFDFLTIGTELAERQLEDALVGHISTFLLELGAGFAYVGRQVPLEVDGRDFFIDLLFYHLNLRCFVVVELKAGELQPEHVGKLNFYLSAVDSQMRRETDAPSIGLLLVKTKSRIFAEYALRDTTKPMGISEYRLNKALPKKLEASLPSIAQIEAELAEPSSTTKLPPPREEPTPMTPKLPKLLQPALKSLERDLLARAKGAAVEAGLRAAWEEESAAGETGLGFDSWRRERTTQLAVAWVLSLVFVRTLEDRGAIDPRVAGADAEALRAAEDREALFLQIAPFLGPREYLLTVFRELCHLPGARDVFDPKHNPVWQLAPSSEGARALLDFFRKRDEHGAPLLRFFGQDTRFLGDLYQDLSEAARKRHALLQTPEFVEEFILDRTLEPAIVAFGLRRVNLIDPTCGSGHFLLGAFRRLLAHWQREAPSEPVAELARRALEQVCGVDINPYAVAIARFRLVLAVLDALGLARLADAPTIQPRVVVADSLLHRLEQRTLSVGQLSLDDHAEWGRPLFRLEDRRAVEQVLGQRFHAVVGNPPYITEKDAKKRNIYREMYESAAGNYALSAPFVERFFDLAVDGGFVGMINSNAWTKRDFGKALIEKVLPRLDVQQIIDTSGCYLPGHGTPTLLLFGRNRAPSGDGVIAVLGKRGEQAVPDDPARAPVWSEIIAHHDEIGFDGAFVSVESAPRSEINKHPWVLAGGGGRSLLRMLASGSPQTLQFHANSIGNLCITGNDDVYVHSIENPIRLGASPAKPYVSGDRIREWDVSIDTCCLWPFDDDSKPVPENHERKIFRFLWAYRTNLITRRRFGVPILERGLAWYELREFYWNKTLSPFRIVYSFVATHNHFALDRGGKIFNRHAPIIASDLDEADHQALLGYLNSSTVGFWCRLVMFPKGGDQVGDGARLSAAQWSRYLEYACNLLQQLPVPKLDDLRDKLLELVIAIEQTVQSLGELAPPAVVAQTLENTPSLAALKQARDASVAERARLRAIMVSLQEEIDWRVYGLFGLPTLEAPSLEAACVPVAPNHRPFEVRLARDVGRDVSASEWFRVHKREAPKDVGGPLAELYQKRLRLLDHPEHGKHLRLLEAPETKRRWSPQDDSKAFADAVRSWLLSRLEQHFREQSQPELRTARQLALELGREPAMIAAHELLCESSGYDLSKLLSELVDAEGVPFLAGYRYTELGMEKRKSWEETWRLQRLEDQGKLEPELERLKQKAIGVPEKYGKNDFLRHYWGLRGKLDVPKERFVTVPGGNTEDDQTPLIGWAGWDHLQLAQALSGLYQRRKTDDGWTRDRLLPLLAGIDERVPWLLQWHNEPAAAFGGMKLGDFFRDFVASEAHALGLAAAELRTWTPPAAPRRQSVAAEELLAALNAFAPEADDDADDDDAPPPEGATDAELAAALGVNKAAVTRALKALIDAGQVEKRPGRPARYVATGEQG